MAGAKNNELGFGTIAVIGGLGFAVGCLGAMLYYLKKENPDRMDFMERARKIKSQQEMKSTRNIDLDLIAIVDWMEQYKIDKPEHGAMIPDDHEMSQMVKLAYQLGNH